MSEFFLADGKSRWLAAEEHQTRLKELWQTISDRYAESWSRFPV